jgi:hypothetical protein
MKKATKKIPMMLTVGKMAGGKKGKWVRKDEQTKAASGMANGYS